MVKIIKNKSLKEFNTFGMDVFASEYVEVTTLEALQWILANHTGKNKFLLSGGSNILLTKDIEALVVHLNTKGISIASEDKDSKIVKIMGGEIWHEVVMWAIDQNLGGIENLALIPGKAGTAPIQNIGAYGVEIKDVLVGCDAIEIDSGKFRHFGTAACELGYRDSIFKGRLKSQYIITAIYLRLSNKNHKISTSYGAISGQLEKMDVQDPTIRQVAEAVIEIRRKKLPDPAKIGNAGSFFKNPVLPEGDFREIQNNNPNIPHYHQDNGNVKIPAAWLIDQCGLKGLEKGNVGINKNQPLVLINLGNAKGSEVADLAQFVQKEVKKRFGIALQPEVNII